MEKYKLHCEKNDDINCSVRNGNLIYFANSVLQQKELNTKERIILYYYCVNKCASMVKKNRSIKYVIEYLCKEWDWDDLFESDNELVTEELREINSIVCSSRPCIMYNNHYDNLTSSQYWELMRGFKEIIIYNYYITMPKILCHISTTQQYNEHTKQYHQNYYLENKQRIITAMSEKTHCPYCDTQITKCKFDRHLRTAKHQRNVADFGEIH
eukprot:gene8448-273_t